MAILWALRRLRAEPFIAGGAVVTVTLALVLLASGPIFADAVSTGALRQTMKDAPTAETAIEVAGRVEVARVAEVDLIVTSSVLDASVGVRSELTRTIVAAETFALPDQPDTERIDVARLVWVEELIEHATLVQGVWAADYESSDGTVPVVVDAEAASVLGLDLGRRVALTARTSTASDVSAQIVGHYRVDEPSAPFWHERVRIAEPLTLTTSFRTVTFVVPRESVISGISPRPILSWLVLSSFESLELDDVEPLRRSTGALEAEINARLSVPDVEPPLTLSTTTALGGLLVDSNRTLSVARAVIIATIIQLAALAAFALLLVGGLGVEARRAEASVLRARGAGAAQMTGEALVEAALIVVPVALLAPTLATSLVAVFDQFEPLASIGFELQPRPVRGAWLITAIAAVVTIGLLTWPSARAARLAAAEGAVTRQRSRGVLQRSGLDLTVLAVAAFAYWQLRVLGDDRATAVRGRFGVDPMVIVAPTFGLVAGALLALRALPAAIRMAERIVTRGRGAVSALAVWQLARRPHRFTRTALLLIMAMSVGVFAAAYEQTWTASQEARAAHEVVVDARLTPNRRTGDSIGALQIASVLEATSGVEGAMAIVELESELPGAAGPGRLLALDARSDVVVGAAAEDPDLATALDLLGAARPEIPGVELPGAPITISFPTEVYAVDQAGERIEPDPNAPPIAPLAGVLSISLLDADGLLHTVNTGSLGFGVTERTAELGVPAAGPSAVPRAPLRIVDVQLDTVTHGAVSRIIRVELGRLEVVDSAGTVTTVSLAEVPLAASSEVLGFLANPTAVTVASRDSDETLVITVTSGSSLLGVPVVHTVARPQLPSAEILPGVASRAWATATGVEVGDVINVPTDRVDGLRVEIIGHVGVVPGVESDQQAAVMVDLPSMQWSERTPGRPSRAISEYWLTLAPSRETTVEALSRPPVEAVETVTLRERRSELTSNPPALGSLGALGVGFIAALVFAIAALVVTAVVSVRERRAELAVLEALGLSARQRRGWLLQEQIATVMVGVLIGAIVGLGLSLLVLPVMSLSSDGSASFPPVIVLIPWMRVVALAAAVAVASMVGVVAALLVAARASTSAALRAGTES